MEYRGDWPPEIREVVEPHVDEFSRLVPPWMPDLIVRWQTQDGDEALQVMVNHVHRFMVVYVSPAWLNEGSEARRRAWAHEMIHAHLEPMWDYLKGLVRTYTPEVGRAFLEEQGEDHIERAVTDLSAIIVPFD